jgi:hypothetical protein
VKLYYRLVQQWVTGAWQTVAEGYVSAYMPGCQFEGPSFCSIAPPYLEERWWRWEYSTFGTGGGWVLEATEKNWI